MYVIWMLFVNTVLRISARDRVDATKKWKKLHNKELYGL